MYVCNRNYDMSIHILVLFPAPKYYPHWFYLQLSRWGEKYSEQNVSWGKMKVSVGRGWECKYSYWFFVAIVCISAYDSQFLVCEVSWLNISWEFNDSICRRKNGGDLQTPWWEKVKWGMKMQRTGGSLYIPWQLCHCASYSQNMKWEEDVRAQYLKTVIG